MLVDEVSLTNTKNVGYVDFDFRLDFRLFFPVLAVENLYLRTGVVGSLLSEFRHPGVSSVGALHLQKPILLELVAVERFQFTRQRPGDLH